MATRSHFEYYLELLNRCYLAWEALRLNPAFRAEYNVHKPYITWVQNNYPTGLSENPSQNTYFSQEPNPKAEWVRRFSEKWGLAFEDVIYWDPEVRQKHINFISDFSFCKKNCITADIDFPWGFKCTCKPIKNFRKQCFARYNHLLRALPFASRLNNIYVYPGNPLPGGTLDKKDSSFIRNEEAAGRILLWVRGDTLREVAEWQVLRLVSTARQNHSGHKSTGTAPIRVKSVCGYLIFSISISAPKLKVISALKTHLKRSVRPYQFSQAANLIEALQIYEARVYRKIPLWKMVEKKFGAGKLRRHKQLVKEGCSSPYGRYFTDRQSRAARLIRHNLIPPPQLTRASASGKQKDSLLMSLLPAKPPPLNA